MDRTGLTLADAPVAGHPVGARRVRLRADESPATSDAGDLHDVHGAVSGQRPNETRARPGGRSRPGSGGETE